MERPYSLLQRGAVPAEGSQGRAVAGPVATQHVPCAVWFSALWPDAEAFPELEARLLCTVCLVKARLERTEGLLWEQSNLRRRCTALLTPPRAFGDPRSG